jgi:co-chaperonin GroES (HSP10)
VVFIPDTAKKKTAKELLLQLGITKKNTMTVKSGDSVLYENIRIYRAEIRR